MDLVIKPLKCLSSFVEVDCIKCVRLADRQITRNLREANISTRPAKSNGLWCCTLIPAILIINNVLHTVSPVYTLVTYISVGLLVYSLLFVGFISVSCLVLKESNYGGCGASALVSALLLYNILEIDFITSLLFTLPTVYLFSLLLRISLVQFPKTFTVGEAVIVVQSIVLYLVMTVCHFYYGIEDKSLAYIKKIVDMVLLTVFIVVTALVAISKNKKQYGIKCFLYVITGAAAIGLSMLHAVLGRNCLMEIIDFIFFQGIRMQLISFWLGLVLLAVFLLLIRTKLAKKASTVTRKSFHILASLVFMSGYLFDVHLMILASGIGLGLLIFVEALRKSNIEPISSALQSAFIVYSDEKDVGVFAMTPFYLYCGLACPVLLVPFEECHKLELLSGVLSIGVGDTAASWFGSRYGYNKWPNSRKSFEGTSFNILSQILTVYALKVFELIEGNDLLIRTAIAATLSGLVEAKTEQVDNLILPLVSLIGFKMTWFLFYNDITKS